MVGICWESEAKSAAAPTKRGRVGPGAWGRGTPRGDHLGPAQALSPPHSPEGETQLHRGGVPDAQNSWPPVGGHPPEKGLQRRPPQTLLSDTTSRAGLTWLVRRSPLKGSTGGTPALKLPNKSPPCSVPQFLPGTRGRASKRCARTRGSGRTASTIWRTWRNPAPRACVRYPPKGGQYLRVTARGPPAPHFIIQPCSSVLTEPQGLRTSRLDGRQGPCSSGPTRAHPALTPRDRGGMERLSEEPQKRLVTAIISVIYRRFAFAGPSAPGGGCREKERWACGGTRRITW